MIHFDAATHTYTDANGRTIPSVTTILKPLGGYDGIPAHILDRAARRGTAVHLACEYDDEGFDFDCADSISPYLQAWRAFKAQHLPTFIAIETRVHHPVLGYAGTFDRLASIDGKRVLIDLKTTVKIMPIVKLQLAAYAHALPELPDECWAVYLRQDGTFDVLITKPSDGWPEFLALLTLWNFSRKHKLRNAFC